MNPVARYVVSAMFPNPFLDWLLISQTDRGRECPCYVQHGNYVLNRLNNVSSVQAELSGQIFEEKENVFLE